MSKRCEDCKHGTPIADWYFCEREYLDCRDARATGLFWSIILHDCGKSGRKWEAK